jgi:uncharacterized protein
MKIELNKLKQYMIEKLSRELPNNLYYHSVMHIMDVYDAAIMIGQQENISTSDMELLSAAVLFHDSGFIFQNKNHEHKGCEIVHDILPDFGYSSYEITRICGMIMATRIPQSPQNKLEEIICDADLDYLGRNDFWEIGTYLFKELNEYGATLTTNKWNELQASFLESHQYFTSTAKKLREKKKMDHLAKLKLLLKNQS